MKHNYVLSIKLLLGLMVILSSSKGLSQCAIFSETFDTSLGQFTTSNNNGGNWQFTNSCTYSSATGHSAPGSALYSGSGCEFGNGFNQVWGDMTSPSVLIPPTGAELSFNYYLYNECGNSGSDCYFDRLALQISDDNGNSFETIMDSYTNYGNGILYNGGWYAVTFDLSAYAGEEILIRFNFNSIDGAINQYDGVYIDDVVVTAICPYNNDAGIANIISPALPTCDLDSVDVTVALQSLGLDTLYTCLIKWQVGNGPVSTFNYTGMVPPMGGLDTVTLTNISFSNLNELTVWTELPNGDTDSLPQNDEDSMIVAMGLNGIYTIPGDYATLNAAADDLNAFGVCGNVVFNIATGTYTEQVTFGNILGVNANATVTFQSATGDSADVWIEYESTSQPDNWVIKFIGTDWLYLKDLSIKNNGQYEFANCISMVSEATHNTIERCHLVSNTYGYWEVGDFATGVYLVGPHMQNAILDSKIEQGNCGIYSAGSSSNRAHDLLVEGCTIEDVYSTSAYILYTDEFNFLHNTVTADAGLDYYSEGLMMYYSDNFNIVGNYIGSNYLNGYAYALLMDNCYGSNNPRSQVANNCLQAGSETSSTYGFNTVYMYSTGIIDMYHNTLIRHGWSGNSTYYVDNGGLIRMKNNVLADMNDGYAFTCYGVFSITESNNNNFYTTGNTLLYWGSNAFPNLETYQEASGFDLNSTVSDPAFQNQAKCITCNEEMDGGGAPLSQVNDDIEGNTRSVSAPDIGAVEFVNGSSFTLGPDTTLCATTYMLEAGPASGVVWNVDGNIITTPDYELVTSGIPQTFNVMVNVTTLYCGNGDDTVIITLIPNVELDSSIHICADETITLQPGGGTNATYLWNTGATTASIDVSEPGIYSVSKSEEGCESTAFTELTVSTAVDIADLDACEDDIPVTINAAIPDGTAYSWSGGSTPSTAINSFDTEGTYNVTATDAFGCISSDEFELLLLGEPVAVIDYVATAGLAYFFNSQNSQETGSSTTYLWTFNGTDTSSAPNPSYVFPWSVTPVSYPVMLQIDNGCGIDIEEIQISVATGTDELANRKNFSVFPNPGTDVLNIKGNQEWEAIEISILDNAGRTVYFLDHARASDFLELNVSKLARGTYMMTIATPSTIEIHPLVLN